MTRLVALVVDDNGTRAQRAKVILVDAGLEPQNVILCGSITAATKQFLDRRIDLLVTDIAIPQLDDESAIPDGGQCLIRQLDELAPQVVPPRWTVAITAYEESKRLTAAEFGTRLVSVLNANATSNAWEDQLSHFCKRCIDSDKVDRSALADVCYLTALRSPELEALRSLPVEWGMKTVSPFFANQQSGQMQIQGKSIAVESFTYDRMGLVPISYLTAAVVATYRPRLLLLSGICGGIPDSVKLGDVVVAESCWNWQAGKLKSNDRMKVDADSIQASASLVAIARHISDSNDVRLGLMSYAQQFKEHRDRIPVIHVGPMASGSAVVADEDIKEEIVRQNRKVLALDMEGYGFYAASRFSSIGDTKLVCVKGVCDKADDEKADELQTMCALRSADVASQIVKTYMTADAENGSI
jgi:nucleoside phosphorylase